MIDRAARRSSGPDGTGSRDQGPNISPRPAGGALALDERDQRPCSGRAGSRLTDAMTTLLSTAYGGGGVFGIAYILGVGEALIDAGVLLADAPALGTSAGSWAACAMELGIRWDDAIALIGDEIPRWPDPRSGRLRAAAAELFGERRAPLTRAVACTLPRLQRIVLSGADHPAADLVAASSAVPGMLAPHRIGGCRYVDGGVRSLVSADLAAPAEVLLVVAPIAGPMFGPAGRLAERILRRETDAWERANEGSSLWLIRPNHVIAELADWPVQLFDGDRARRCHDLAYEQASRLLREGVTPASPPSARGADGPRTHSEA